MLLLAGVAQAEAAFGPYGGVAESYDSNVLQISSKDEAIAANGDDQRDDLITEQLAGAKAIYRWGLQKIDFAAEGRRYEFQHFDALDHNEYLFGGGFDWKLGDRLNGRLSYQQDRKLAMFADLGTTALTLQNERTADSDLIYRILPEWSLEGDAQYHESRLPLVDSPQFKLGDSAGLATLRYLGIETLTVGISSGYSQGSYSGIEDASSFKQSTYNLVADYAISGLSSAQLQAGYTMRRNDQATGGGDVAGFTGTLGYRRRISVKTWVDAQLYRSINSYVAGSNSEVDQGLMTHIAYAPTAKTTLNLSYQWLYSSFRGSTVVDAAPTPTDGRQDHYQITQLKLLYQPLRWLDMDLFARYQDRHSNVLINGFNDSSVGLELRAHFGGDPAVQSDAGAGSGSLLF